MESLGHSIISLNNLMTWNAFHNKPSNICDSNTLHVKNKFIYLCVFKSLTLIVFNICNFIEFTIWGKGEVAGGRAC